jgi:hypothetical protein
LTDGFLETSRRGSAESSVLQPGAKAVVTVWSERRFGLKEEANILEIDESSTRVSRAVK